MKTCLSCYKTFNRNSDVIEGSACPTLMCRGRICEIDDNIYYTLIELNKKGYETLDSCSGHTTGNTGPYIFFTSEFCEHSFPFMPQGFKSEQTLDGNFRLYSEMREQPAWQKQQSLMEASVSLINWSSSLRTAKEIIIDFHVNKDSKKKKEISRIKKLVKGKLNLNFSHLANDWEPDSSDEYDPLLIEYTTYADSREVERFSEKIKTFADRYNLSYNLTEIPNRRCTHG